MSRRIISLNDDQWHLGSVAQKPFADVNDFADARAWLPAQVPGDVRLDLLRAGKIPDPFFADHNEQSQWVDTYDWWYARELNLALEQDARAFLVFEGIDYQSAVFVNGKQLGRHAGMFSRQVYEITTAVSRPQTAAVLQQSSVSSQRSSLAVRIWGSGALPKMRLSPSEKLYAALIRPFIPPPSQPYPDYFATLKAPMQFGWDFAPRLRTCGIWDEAYVVVTRSVFIEDIWVNPQLKIQNPKLADIGLTLTLDSDREQMAQARITIREKNSPAPVLTHTHPLILQPSKQTIPLALQLENPRVWNPWDRGAPNLYEIEIQIQTPAGAALDTHTETFGVRALELARVEGARGDAEPWTFIVNGTREFLRGANWAPLDALPARVTRADYERRLRQARDANINFIRVWGGGLREKRAFYDVCDELGILVWQEFPFAGAILDRFPHDRAHLQFVAAECGAIVRALRNHPSLVVWCGGNEFNTRGNRPIVNTLRETVERADGTRPFRPASPYRDESHNWRVWHRLANMLDYRRDSTPFLSEFGMQAAPNVETLKRFLPPDLLFPPNGLWEYHHAQLRKLFRYARATPATLAEFVAATQRAQTHALQIAVEHMRRRKGKTAGVAVWQLNDPWPNISWSIIDYAGVPKRAYYALKQLYAPVLVSFDYALAPRRAGDVVAGDLWLVNDRLESLAAVDVRAYHNGKEVYARRGGAGADSAARIDALTVRLADGANVLRLVACDDARVWCENEYDLNFCDVGEISLFARFFTFIANKLMK